MHVLLVVGGFAGPGREPWLLDDLAQALAARGHTVHVVVGDTKTPRPRGAQAGSDPGITVFSVGATRITRGRFSKLIRHVGVGVRLHTLAYQWVSRHRYDLCIYTSPASFSWLFPRRVRRRRIAARSLLFLWDFFPVHQIEIGRIRWRHLAGVMKVVERAAIAGADTVALMTAAGTRFYREYHRRMGTRTIEIPPWSSSKDIPPSPPTTPPLRVIFGGQLAKGRGVDTLLDAASIAARQLKEVEFWIAGDGPERQALESQARELALTNVRFFGALSREEYRARARHAHLGVAITVPGITPPSFPSKIVEYCGLGLPVLVCVEDSSDAGTFVTEAGAGFAAPAGDATAIARALAEADAMLRDGSLGAMSEAALSLYDSRLSVERAVDALESLVARQEAP